MTPKTAPNLEAAKAVIKAAGLTPSLASYGPDAEGRPGCAFSVETDGPETYNAAKLCVFIPAPPTRDELEAELEAIYRAGEERGYPDTAAEQHVIERIRALGPIQGVDFLSRSQVN
jgi:hypothetical protein